MRQSLDDDGGKNWGAPCAKNGKGLHDLSVRFNCPVEHNTPIVNDV